MRDMTNWVITQAHGLVLIGKLDMVILAPVYELKSAIIQQPPRGEPAHIVMAGPLWLFTSIKSISIPDDAIIVRVETLDDSEQRAISNAIDGAEKMIQQMRMQKAGIALAGG